jgi:hypothetical protein
MTRGIDQHIFVVKGKNPKLKCLIITYVSGKQVVSMSRGKL